MLQEVPPHKTMWHSYFSLLHGHTAMTSLQNTTAQQLNLKEAIMVSNFIFSCTMVVNSEQSDHSIGAPILVGKSFLHGF